VGGICEIVALVILYVRDNNVSNTRLANSIPMFIGDNWRSGPSIMLAVQIMNGLHCTHR
jgi:hypothetical protein